MGNCCHPFGLTKTSKSHQKNIVLLLVGLDNAGKTTAAKNLVGEPLDTVVPTVGFSSFSLTHRGYCVVIYDLGGGPQIREIWHRYFVDVHGVIFVVDASDMSRLEEGRGVLENLLSHEKLTGKPVLLLANKQDCEGALDELDIVERLNIEAVVNQYRCPTLVEMCTAIAVKNSHRKLDPAIHNGFRWLINCIIRDYSNLNNQVESDVAVQKKQEEQEKKERLERIRKAREERGEDITGGITANGTCNGEMHEDSDSDIVMANPFRPIADIMEDIKSPVAPIVEPVLNTRVILVKESPKKIQPSNEEKENQLDSDRQTSNVKRFVDIDGDEVVLVANAKSRESLRSGTDDKNSFGSAVIVGQYPSPSHSVTELIKDQLELEVVHHKKHRFLHRTNRTAPAPLGPASPNCQHSLDETDLDEIRKCNLKQVKSKPMFLRKQAFVEETGMSRESPVSLKKKQYVDKSNLFCLNTGSASSEHVASSYSDLEKRKAFHETNSSDDKNRKRPHIEHKLTNTKMQPMNTETSLPSSVIEGGFQLPVESHKVTSVKEIKQISSIFASSQGHSGSKEDGDAACHQLSDVEKSLRTEQPSVENHSTDHSRQNSAQQDETRLKKQLPVNETSSDGTRSQMGSQHLTDSGFVSPKTVLPPIQFTSSVDKPPWILPPLLSETKHSSQDSLLEMNKPHAAAVAGKSDVSHGSNFETVKDAENS